MNERLGSELFTAALAILGIGSVLCCIANWRAKP